MNTVKMTIAQFRALTIEEAVSLLGITPTENTYVYFNEKWELDTVEIQDHTAVPEDEFLALGFASSYR